MAIFNSYVKLPEGSTSPPHTHAKKEIEFGKVPVFEYRILLFYLLVWGTFCTYSIAEDRRSLIEEFWGAIRNN